MKHATLTSVQVPSKQVDFSLEEKSLECNLVDQPLTDSLSFILKNSPEDESSEWFNESPF
jgi:hypothetical protein